jgi:peptide/nickel transport system permease protein
MTRYILGRTIQAFITIWFVSVIIFLLARLAGSPLDVMLPATATKEDYRAMEVKLGLNEPIYIQYGIFFKNAVRGDLGESVRFHRPALSVVLERLPNTIRLSALGFAVALIIGVPVGVYSAKSRGKALDFFARGFAIIGQSLPHFWTGIILILFFAVWLDMLPAAGMGGPATYILPMTVIGYTVAAGIMRLTRSAMLDVLDAEYIKLARSKGLLEFIVTWKHAFKNALLPVLTFAVVIFVRILVGSIVTETVFAWPGIGRMVVESITYRDYPVIQTIVIIMSGMYISGNLAVDIMYGVIDPTIRKG